jgi:hypothetical protein
MNVFAALIRFAVRWLSALALGVASAWAAGGGFAVATFTADVTIPAGHAMIGGGNYYSSVVVDPLYAKGVVLLGGGAPIVFVSVDWCEIRNDAYTRWREVLAEAAGTTPDRVLVSSVHQHEAPVVDLTAQRLMEAHGLDNSICDLAFHEEAVQRVGRAVRAALPASRPITGIGLGQAKVERIASNRRYHLPDGTVSYNRTSAAAKNILARDGEEGTIDPWLKTLTLWAGEEAVVALSTYAVHPMSYYRTGEISADFVGIARDRRQQDTTGCFQVYFSGASGNVTAGKYNDGSRMVRPLLAGRLYAGMLAAWQATQRVPLTKLEFRSTKVRIEPRRDAGFSSAELEAKLTPATPPHERSLAAMGLSWRQRTDAGHELDLPLIDFGSAQLLLLPGEMYVEYQLAAQQMRPDSFVLVAGFGESATGYFPIERAWAEKDHNLDDWCWVAPGSEQPMLAAIRRVLVPGAQSKAP